MPNRREPEPGQEPDQRHEQHPPRRVEPERDRDEERRAAVDARLRGDPGRLRGHELVHVDRRCEDRVVGLLVDAADERDEHPGERAREQDRGRHHAGAEELDVGVAPDDGHQRAEAEPERQQVDRRLDHRGERRGPPVAPEERRLALPHARHGRQLEPAHPGHRLRHGDAGVGHSIFSPVSSTNTSSRLAARCTPSPSLSASSGGIASARSTETAGPVRRVGSPAAWARPSTSSSRSGLP